MYVRELVKQLDELGVKTFLRTTLMRALLPGMEPDYAHLPEVFNCFSMTLLADNTLSPPVLKEYRDSRNWDPEYYTLAPHVFCERGARQYHMSQEIFIWDLSRPKLALGQVLQVPLMWSWAEQVQSITILGLGSQDLVRGIWSVEKVLREPNFWVDQLKRVTREMDAYKCRFATRTGRLEEFHEWHRRHTYLAYPLPEIPPAEIEKEGKISEADYFLVKRRQHKSFDKPGIQAELRRHNIHLLRPSILKPEFEDGRLAGESATSYVAPIFEFVRKWFCARCREPRLHNGTWQNCTRFLLPSQNLCKRARKKARKAKVLKFRVLDEVPEEIWEMIFTYLSIFDIGVLRMVCKTFYRLCHSPNVRKCEGFVLDLEVEQLKLKVPE